MEASAARRGWARDAGAKSRTRDACPATYDQIEPRCPRQPGWGSMAGATGLCQTLTSAGPSTCQTGARESPRPPWGGKACAAGSLADRPACSKGLSQPSTTECLSWFSAAPSGSRRQARWRALSLSLTSVLVRPFTLRRIMMHVGETCNPLLGGDTPGEYAACQVPR
jgi:hypothetical protein